MLKKRQINASATLGLVFYGDQLGGETVKEMM